MITLNNSNIDFGFEDESLGSKYSISLSRDTSNLIFKTDGVERMTIMKNGKVGIEYDLDVNGRINAGSYLINGEDISIITSDTSNYISITSNILIGCINDASNYVAYTCNILIGHINDTSNYVRITSNILIGRFNDNSNYVGTTSNILIGRINDTSNYVRITSNILIGSINNASNYVKNASNILISCINDTSNYTKDTSNIFVGRINDTSNILIYTSNILVYHINYTSNYVGITCNILVGRINDTSNYARTTSNILIGCINNTCNYLISISDILVGHFNDTSNYVGITSNILIDNINNASNYVKNASNILVGRFNDTSNYVKDTSNISIGRINVTSNYVKDTSNILIGLFNDTCNYVGTTSNILIGRFNDNSNYVGTTSNILIGRINDTSNYVKDTCNILIGRFNDNSNYVETTSNILIGRINDTSNYVKNASNILVSRFNDTSNYTKDTSNILIGCINDTSNYTKDTSNNIVNLINSSINNKWLSNNNKIYYNNYNVGIGTNNPQSKLHLYDDVSNSTSLTMINSDKCYTISNTSSTISPQYGITVEGYSFIQFKHDQRTATTSMYNFTIGENDLIADVLIVGGGGGGGSGTTQYWGGGGGGGAVHYFVNHTFIKNTQYGIVVGNGGLANNNGTSSYISMQGSYVLFTQGNVNRSFYAYGGGRGGTYTTNNGIGGNGGSGGGGSSGPSNATQSGGTAIETNVIWNSVNYNSFKYAGGSGGGDLYNTVSTRPGSGGGAGGVGKSGTDPGVFIGDLVGGAGVTIPNMSITGTNYANYVCGGGGGAMGGNGKDGGGQGHVYYTGGNGTVDKGGGGGGGGTYQGVGGSGGKGGSGVIIIRYVTSRIIPFEFKNKSTTYTILNYNADFKITLTKNTIQADILVIKSTGFVGLGTSYPYYMLDVLDNRNPVEVSFRDIGYYFRANIAPIISKTLSYTSTSRFCAKFNDSILLTSTGIFLISSDIRIKEDIQDINDDYALRMILAIELKTYKYIDKIKKGDSNVYGFIAQQVKNIIPEAVNIEKSYIPNIMMEAEYNKKTIILPYKPSKVTIKIKDKIKCYDEDNIMIEIEVSEIINEVSFKIKDLDKEYTNNKIFIYGTYVDDFHTLFKDHIFTLNIGATQELYKQLKKQKDIIKLQEDKMGRLERENDELENKFNKLLEELVLINKQFD